MSPVMIALQGEKTKVASDFGRSVEREDPVIIQKGLVSSWSWIDPCSARGTGGAELAKAADEISLLDIYRGNA